MRAMARATMTAMGLSLGLAGCAESLAPPAPPPAPAAVAPDALGPKPVLAAPKPFEPPAPQVLKTANGMTVWLVERHALPMVAVTLTIPYGSASDPRGKAGLAHITADMLDEGAGKRDAVTVSTAINDLGASLATGAGVDGSLVSLVTLKKNLKPAFEIFGDVVVHPELDAKEWKRVSSLWKNDLQKRAQDAGAVARVAMSAALYGRGSPYGHPSNGLAATAAKIDLPAVKAFYAAHYRPDKATLVVVGDVTRGEVEQLVTTTFGKWKAPAKTAEAMPEATLRSDRPKLVLVDRPDAPQSVIAVVRDGVAASDPKAPLLDLVNTALGGSFTSRLNQDLREEHGWSYGAGSRFVETRSKGAFLAVASVMTEVTGQALQAMVGDLDKMATGGLTPEELQKVRAQDRADLLQTYETVGGISRRLGALSMLGLPPDFDATASRARQHADKPKLDTLSAAVSPKAATIVVVGPSAVVKPQLAELRLGQPVMLDPEGDPLP